MANYNKKKRKGLAAILVMAIVIVLGGGTAFAYPYLETAYSPKAQVLAALQTAGEESKQGMQTMISEVSDLLTGQTQLAGNVTFTRAELDGKDYLKEHVLSKGTFKLQLDAAKRTVNGNITAEGSEKKREAEVSVGEKDLKEFLKEAGYESYYNRLHTILNSVDADTMQEYMQVADKLTEQAYGAAGTVLNQSTYEKEGKEMLEINGTQLSTVKYTVTVGKEAWMAGVEDFLNRVYADKELNSYTTMLATFTGYSKYDLQQQAETLFSDFTQVNLYVYLDKDKNLVRLSTSFDTGFCEAVLEAQGLEKWNEQTAVRIKSERSELTAVGENTDMVSKVNLNVRYHETGSQPSGTVALTVEKQNNYLSCTLGKVTAKAKGHEAAVEFTGECTYQFR